MYNTVHNASYLMYNTLCTIHNAQYSTQCVISNVQEVEVCGWCTWPSASASSGWKPLCWGCHKVCKGMKHREEEHNQWFWWLRTGLGCEQQSAHLIGPTCLMRGGAPGPPFVDTLDDCSGHRGTGWEALDLVCISGDEQAASQTQPPLFFFQRRALDLVCTSGEEQGALHPTLSLHLGSRDHWSAKCIKCEARCRLVLEKCLDDEQSVCTRWCTASGQGQQVPRRASSGTASCCRSWPMWSAMWLPCWRPRRTSWPWWICQSLPRRCICLFQMLTSPIVTLRHGADRCEALLPPCGWKPLASRAAIHR